MFFDILQLCGGIIMSFGQIPQIIQILKTKSAVDLNLKTYIMMFAGILLMEFYAVNLVIKGTGGAFLITNTFSLTASAVMIALILRYGSTGGNVKSPNLPGKKFKQPGVAIRPVRIEDFADISRIRKMDGVMEYLLSNPDDPDDRIREKIEGITDDDYWFVAEKDGKIVGTAILNRYKNVRKKHAAEVTIMVDRDYHSIGIGTALMEKLIDLSDNVLHLKRMELFVFTDNKKALGLYRKFGFKTEGVQRFSALKDGRYASEMIMARIRDIG